MKTILDDMTEICNYLKISEATVLKYYQERDLPMRKRGGVWCARKDLLDDWVLSEDFSTDRYRSHNEKPKMRW